MAILLTVFNTLYYIILVLILARVVLSWIRPDPYHPTWGPIVRFVHQATEPLLEPIRRLVPSSSGLDFSPMILLFGLYIVRMLLAGLL